VSLAPDSGTLDGGYFTLDMTRSGQTLTTDFIAFNAPAMAADESSANDDLYCSTRGAGACPSTARGSMESQLEALATITDVSVTRTGSVGTGYSWTITFLDDGSDFVLALNTNEIDAGVNGGSVDVNKEADGSVYGACTGTTTLTGLTQGTPYWARVAAYNSVGFGVTKTTISTQKPIVVPTTPVSVVLAVQSGSELSVSYSAPTDDGGDSISEYLIEWDTSSSFDSGAGSVYNGATITALGYMSESELSGGAPYTSIISGLTKGINYYVRVSAYNTEGFGATSSVENEYPREIPTQPMNVVLGVTSESKMTVMFDSPGDIGGDSITNYRIEWDTSAAFDSNVASATVDATAQKYYTIEGLTTGVAYYVRVSASNSVGYGATIVSSPASAIPAYQVPGKPSTVQVVSSDAQLTVTFGYPRVPAHGLWCGGLTVPALCPVGMGFDHGIVNGEADGGSKITKYIVEWDTVPTFNSGSSAPHAGEMEILAHPTFLEPYNGVISSLTNGQTYYVRVMAYNNAVGGGKPCNREADAVTGLCTGAVISSVPSS
jgi:hypothetical protein